MKVGLAATARAALAILLIAATPATAHRLDEYLQGTLLSIERNRVQAQMTLAPGIAVLPEVLAAIGVETMGTDPNGGISEAMQRAYAARVLGDLSLKIDDQPLTPHLLSVKFPDREAMKDGRGEIRIEFDAALPAGGVNRKLILENHHLSKIAAYQVNCLVPRDRDLRIVAQNRNYSQSRYELDFVQPGVADLGDWPRGWLWRIFGPAAIVAILVSVALLRRRQTQST
jgi:hypothetical protein